MSKPLCPQCRTELSRVERGPESPLNEYQFDAVKAGDWYCDKCLPNDRAQSNLYCYWWDHEVQREEPLHFA